jgi:hypothetical protein
MSGGMSHGRLICLDVRYSLGFWQSHLQEMGEYRYTHSYSDFCLLVHLVLDIEAVGSRVVDSAKS